MITISDVFIELAVSGEGHHYLRKAEGELVSLVHLPKVNGLAVGLAQLLQVGVLHRAGHPGHEEEAALHLELVGVPQGLLQVRQG